LASEFHAVITASSMFSTAGVGTFADLEPACFLFQRFRAFSPLHLLSFRLWPDQRL